MRYSKRYGLFFMFNVLLLFSVTISQAQDEMQDNPITTNEIDSVFNFDSIKNEGLLISRERMIPDSILQQLRKDEAFWYANADIKKNVSKSTVQNRSMLQWLLLQNWFLNLLWFIIIGSFTIVIVLFLLKSNIQLFHKTSTIIASGNGEPTPSIFSLDYQQEVQKAVQEGNFRLAIRLYYLETLAHLSNKKIIKYREDYTNSEYLLQLETTGYYEVFKKLTKHFEYTWYGRFSISPGIFKAMETEFRTFKNNMGI